MKNIGTVERILRVVLGDALAVWALSLFLGTDAALWRLVDVALIAPGLDFGHGHTRLLPAVQVAGLEHGTPRNARLAEDIRDATRTR